MKCRRGQWSLPETWVAHTLLSSLRPTQARCPRWLGAACEVGDFGGGRQALVEGRVIRIER